MKLAGSTHKTKTKKSMKNCPQCSHPTVMQRTDQVFKFLNVPLTKKKGGWIHTCGECDWAEGSIRIEKQPSKYQLRYCMNCSHYVPRDYSECCRCGSQHL